MTHRASVGTDNVLTVMVLVGLLGTAAALPGKRTFLLAGLGVATVVGIVARRELFPDPESWNDEQQALLAQHPARPLYELGRWSVVCALGGGPSYFFALSSYSMLHQQLAMVAGIATFAVAYATLACTPVVRLWLLDEDVHRATRVTFITRVVLSLSAIVPIVGFPALMMDMFCGMFSTSVVESLYALVGEGDSSKSWHGTYLTTLSQGGVLNGILGLYFLTVRAFLRVTRS